MRIRYLLRSPGLPAPRARRRRRQGGVGLVEIIAAMAILAIITTGLCITFFATSNANLLTSQETRANNAAQQGIEDVIGLAKRYGTYLNGYAFDSGGTACRAVFLDAMIAYYQQGTNRFFNVDELDAVPGEEGVGEIILYLDERKVPVELGGARASAFQGAGTERDMRFGPMDLNGDGAFADLSSPTIGGYTDIQKTARRAMWNIHLVPVEVRLRWNSKEGPRTIRRFTLVARTFR